MGTPNLLLAPGAISPRYATDHCITKWKSNKKKEGDWMIEWKTTWRKELAWSCKVKIGLLSSNKKATLRNDKIPQNWLKTWKMSCLIIMKEVKESQLSVFAFFQRSVIFIYNFSQKCAEKQFEENYDGLLKIWNTFFQVRLGLPSLWNFAEVSGISVLKVVSGNDF